MTVFILTEELAEAPLHAAILECLVKSHSLLRGQDVRVRRHGGDIAWLARDHFLAGGAPVALVSSADTVNPDRIMQQVGTREWFIREYVPGAKFLVLMVPPEVEALLFMDPEVMNAVLPGPVSVEDRVRGRYEARKVLTELFARAGEGPFPQTLIQRLTQADLSPLWKLELLRPLEAFLLEVCLGQSAPGPASP